MIMTTDGNTNMKDFNIIKFLEGRPLSWSAISSFDYDPEQWYQRYVLGEKSSETVEMKFGKVVGERLASDPTYLPQVPRLSKYEHPFVVTYKKIKLVGYGDSFCDITKKKLFEYKTGVKPWTQKRADEHGQITIYLFMHYLVEKIRPEEMLCKLVWLPTKKKMNPNLTTEISFVEPVVPKIFTTKRTLIQVLFFGKKIEETVKAMEQYARNHA